MCGLSARVTEPKLGMCALPGAFCADENTTMSDTESMIKDVVSKSITNNRFADVISMEANLSLKHGMIL